MKQMYETKVSWKAVVIQFFLYKFAINMLTIARKRTLISLQSGSTSTMAYQMVGTASSSLPHAFSASLPILAAANVHSATLASSIASYATNSLPKMHTRPSQCRWTSASAIQQLALRTSAASKNLERWRAALPWRWTEPHQQTTRLQLPQCCAGQ